MVIFVKPNGETVVENALLSVGSHGGRISIVAPSRAGSFVQMIVQTPTGEVMPPIYAVPAMSVDAENIGLYSCGISPDITSVAGRVGYQLLFEYEDGETEVTPQGTFIVQAGSIKIPSDDPSVSMYEEIKQAMISASVNYVDLLQRIENLPEGGGGGSNIIFSSDEEVKNILDKIYGDNV